MGSLIFLLLAATLVAGVIAYRRKRSDEGIARGLDFEHWAVVEDGKHNSNTDMIAWQSGFLLVHAASPWHLGSTSCRIVVRFSRDGRSWERWAELGVPGHDIRDPKLAIIGGELFLYALPNTGLTATPTHTVLSTSRDGKSWSRFERVGPRGWLFWRPKSPDGGLTWYVPAYWHAHGASILLRSNDGRKWEEVSQIHEGDGNDETDIEFLPDGRMLATARLEITPDRLRGNAQACTLIATAPPPFTSWTKHRSAVTRLDGPYLFRDRDVVFAVARRQVGERGSFTQLGGLFSRKRTAIFRVEPDRLVHLSDLPSQGDTSYAGVVVRDGIAWIDYYTNRIDRDWPWFMGMPLASHIWMARVSLESLHRLSAERRA